MIFLITRHQVLFLMGIDMAKKGQTLGAFLKTAGIKCRLIKEDCQNFATRHFVLM
jgi:hypothetical protein